MAKMRAMVVRERGAQFVAEERDIPAPGPEEIRIRVQACGVCHSDVVTVQGLFPIFRVKFLKGTFEVLRSGLGRPQHHSVIHFLGIPSHQQGNFGLFAFLKDFGRIL